MLRLRVNTALDGLGEQFLNLRSRQVGECGPCLHDAETECLVLSFQCERENFVVRSDKLKVSADPSCDVHCEIFHGVGAGLVSVNNRGVYH